MLYDPSALKLLKGKRMELVTVCEHSRFYILVMRIKR
jgi:hypothetical protein